MLKLSKVLLNSLWEYDVNLLKYEDEIVINRCLIFWEISDYYILKSEVWEDLIKKIFIKNISSFDKKTANFWKLIFKIQHINSNNHSIYEQLNTPIFKRSIG